ncbi:MAG: hypothetical protein DWQ01_03520 [Planctomycetota bacterium]|nr:MAG: hypothetical protein DWQ01_03520 [Planctomycetota bacterium]
MLQSRIHRQVLAVVLLVAATRTLFWVWRPPPKPLLDPQQGPVGLVPSLDRSDAISLSWLPGIGEEKARRLIRERPHLGVALNPALLPLIAGFGQDAAGEIQRWYQDRGVRLWRVNEHGQWRTVTPH